MSLVNDALRKARLEAARGDAANRGLAYPRLGRAEQPAGRLGVTALAVIVLLVGLGGILLFRAGRQSALRKNLAESTSGEAHLPPDTHRANPETAKALASAGVAQPAGFVKADSASQASQTSPASRSSGANLPESPAQTQPTRTAPHREARQPDSADTAAEPVASGAPARSRPPRNSPEAADPSTNVEAPQRTSGVPPDAGRSQPPPEPDAKAATRSNGTGLSDTAASPTAQKVETRSTSLGREAPAMATETKPREYLRRAEVPGVGVIELGGIAWSGDRPFALVNGRVVRPGDSVAGLLVADIQPNTVRFSSDRGTLVFRLK